MKVLAKSVRVALKMMRVRSGECISLSLCRFPAEVLQRHEAKITTLVD